MSGADDVWIPLVDEPIGAIVARIEAGDPEIGRLTRDPRRALAFRTFSYIRVGILLGQLLVDNETPDGETENWVDALMHDPANSERVRAEVRQVAAEIASDPAYGDEDLGPDEGARDRFREFARRQRST